MQMLYSIWLLSKKELKVSLMAFFYRNLRRKLLFFNFYCSILFYFLFLNSFVG